MSIIHVNTQCNDSKCSISEEENRMQFLKMQQRNLRKCKESINKNIELKSRKMKTIYEEKKTEIRNYII